jgi:replicative DNA helicase
MAVTKSTSRTAPKTTTNNLAFGKLPPQALEMEVAVLGAIMVENNKLSDVLDIIQSPECFYADANKRIYGAIRRLFDKGAPSDYITVCDELKRNGELELVGGYYYVTSLTKDVVSTNSIETHARIIMEKFIMRELIRQSGEIINDAYEDNTDVFDLLDKAESNLYEITDNHLRKSFNGIGSIVLETLKEIQDQRDKQEDITGLPSGFRDLDAITGGWQKSDLIILAARPAVGKTAFALNLVMNAAMSKSKPSSVAFFSLEMSAGQLVKRMLSATTEVLLEKITKGNLADHEIVQIQQRMSRLSESEIFIDDQAALNIFELRAKCRRLKQRNNLGFVVIDYLQLMTASMDKGGNREQEISKISRELKGLAKELNIPIIALSQLSRSVETRGGSKVPQLSDLRESGAIEQDADMVMFLYRPDYYVNQGGPAAPPSKNKNDQEDVPTEPGETWINIAKHRNGQTGMVKIIAELQYQRFKDKQQDELRSFATAGLDDASKGITGNYNAPSLSIDDSFNSITRGSKINDNPFDNSGGGADAGDAIDDGDAPF